MKKKKVKPSPKRTPKKKTVTKRQQKKASPKAVTGRTKKKAKNMQPKKTASTKPAAKKTHAKAVSKTTKGIKKKKTGSKKVTPKKTHVTKKTKTRLQKKIPVRLPRVAKKVRNAEEERKAALRKVLVMRRREILEEAKTEISKYIKGETRQLVDTALDDGDWSVVDLSEDINLRQLGSHRENLQRIDEALRKLNEDTYGICEDCGDEISRERLQVLPFAIYCVDCQERREKIAEMERGWRTTAPRNPGQARGRDAAGWGAIRGSPPAGSWAGPRGAPSSNTSSIAGSAREAGGGAVWLRHWVTSPRPWTAGP